MLAYPVSDKPINYDNKISMQPKLDGARCLIQYDKKTGVKAYTRTGKEWKNIHHITSSLEKWFQSPDDIDMLESRDMVQFHCYDIIHPDNSPFEDRNRFIRHCVGQSSPYVHIVPTRSCSSETIAKMIHKQNLDNGYEGSILRTNDTYQCKRSHSLRKFKDFQDAEAKITSWVEGKGKRVGTIGKFMAIDADGNEFGMPVMDKFKYLQENFEEMKTWVGKLATFTYFERTNANSYRHPLFKCIRDYE